MRAGPAVAEIKAIDDVILGRAHVEVNEILELP